VKVTLEPVNPLKRVFGSPLVRGGLTLAGGVLTGNAVGFFRVALTAYLLGTHSRADSLAVAMGPVDSLNSMLTNSMVFAFVPMLASRLEPGRTELFLKLRRAFVYLFLAVSLIVIAAAPWLMRVLAPGLDPDSFQAAVKIARILALSTTAAGVASLYWALLYTERRFGPTAFYQATLNLSTIVAAVSLWKVLGVYSFAIGYAMGAFVQLVIGHLAARNSLTKHKLAPVEKDSAIEWRRVIAKPAFFLAYAAGLSLNITFTRAYATDAGSGMAAALEYCMRGVGVPLAILVGPLANSLLPEIARLRSSSRLREAFRLIRRTVLLDALIALGISGISLLLRRPVIALLFQRGSFTAESTRMVSDVFLGLGPALIGWSLLEITARSLFALDRPWPPLIAALVPVLVNAALTLSLHSRRPQWIGVGASTGALAGAALLFLIVWWNRSRWLEQG
jgi:putative peptidoglycan lipid II flippase